MRPTAVRGPNFLPGRTERHVRHRVRSSPTRTVDASHIVAAAIGERHRPGTSTASSPIYGQPLAKAPRSPETILECHLNIRQSVMCTNPPHVVTDDKHFTHAVANKILVQA